MYSRDAECQMCEIIVPTIVLTIAHSTSFLFAIGLYNERSANDSISSLSMIVYRDISSSKYINYKNDYGASSTS